MSLAFERNLVRDHVATIRRKENPKAAARSQLTDISLEPDDPPRTRIKKVFLILNVMRIGKIGKYINPKSEAFSHNQVYVCVNDAQNIFFDKKLGRVPVDAAKYISDLYATFDMYCMNSICIGSISFECLTVEILAQDESPILVNSVLRSLGDDQTKITQKK